MEASALDLLLTEDQEMILAAVADFAGDRVAPQMERIDHAGVHPEALWGEIAGLGLFGLLVPQDRGGAGVGSLAHVAAVEVLARAGGVAGALLATQGLVIDVLLRSGREEIIGDHLDGLTSGAVLGAPALLEDDGGRVACTAVGDGREVRLTGTKVCVAFPGRAGVYVVRGRRGGEEILALVPAGAEGLDHATREPTLGLAALESGRLRLRDTPGVVLGGQTLVDDVLAGARIAVAALLAGIARGGLDHAVRYADERKQFGLALKQFGALQERLARDDARVEALRGLVFGAARLRDLARPHAQAAQRARLLAAEIVPGIADDAVQIYGGYGFSREYPVERHYRDACFVGFGEHHPAHAFRALAAGME